MLLKLRKIEPTYRRFYKDIKISAKKAGLDIGQFEKQLTQKATGAMESIAVTTVGQKINSALENVSKRVGVTTKKKVATKKKTTARKKATKKKTTASTANKSTSNRAAKEKKGTSARKTVATRHVAPS
ncbi:MAG: hypothetical protein OXT67_14030 [Zetaproteobacteria bacterium]|nr:hypothetical protein [Zetaproteobacteria bacterium]